MGSVSTAVSSVRHGVLQWWQQGAIKIIQTASFESQDETRQHAQSKTLNKLSS